MRKNVGYKLLLTLFFLIAAVFYDTSIPLINAVIQLKINILGFFLEPLLQWAFDISLRQAQIISAWIYFLIACFIFWYFLIRIYQNLLIVFYMARQLWSAIKTWQKIGLVFLFMLLVMVMGKTALLFI